MVDEPVRPRIPSQFPSRNPHFVNHEDELDRATAAASGHAGNRVLVFGGVPGTGKTATAIEFAHRVADDYPDGQLLGRLSSSVDQPGTEAEVLHDFLHALGMSSQDIPDRLDARRSLYQGLTAGRRLQVVLDGAVTAGQVRTLLPGDGDSLVLVTEGRPLDALAVDTPVTFLELSPFTDEAARELLVRLVGHEQVAAEPDEVTELIGLCGNLPIALCVVGAMVRRPRNRTFSTMVERLRDERRRITALSLGSDLSLAAVFTAAYRLLGDAAQLCYRALGLRPRSGQIGTDALAAALDLPRYEVAEAMVELVDARLVDEISDDRFDVRELVQLHAEQLDTRPAGDRETEAARLLDFYQQRMVDADEVLAGARPWRRLLFPRLESRHGFVDTESARAWLRLERPNLRAAAEYAADTGEFERVVQWCVLLWPFHEKEKYLQDLFALHQLGLTAAWRLSNTPVQSLLHSQVGFAHYWLGDHDDAAAAFRKAVRLAEDAGDGQLEATAAEGLGLAELAGGDSAGARTLLRRNLELAKVIADDRRIALAMLHLAKVEEPSAALVLLADADKTFALQQGDETENRAKVSTWRGKKHLELGDWVRAREALDAALDTMSTRGRRFDQAEVLVALGDLAAGVGERDRAHGYYREALVCYEDLGFAALAARVRDRISQLGEPGSP